MENSIDSSQNFNHSFHIIKSFQNKKKTMIFDLYNYYIFYKMCLIQEYYDKKTVCMYVETRI